MSLAFLNIQPLLKKYDLRPKKSLGQNFLVEPSALLKVVTTARVTASDYVLEIGAGLGSLTYLLAQQAKAVTAVEIDRKMIPALQEALAGFANVTIVEGDMLKLSPDALMPVENYLVVANIPYYITSAIIRHLLEAEHKPARMVLTIQQEVAERVCARGGKMSLLALSVQVFGKPEIAARIPAGCFFPPPTVDSSVLTIDLYDEPLIPTKDLDAFFDLAHAGFSQKRKTLRNTLASGLGIAPTQAESLLGQAGLDAQRRAEALSLEEWARLTRIWKRTKCGGMEGKLGDK
ncbi:MAG: 16S rRNA (adenine(1518)-N(6)/adenine(1519)-N(6))-dimethyltransferase RsmA [Anaerolineaceae bacterium]